MQKVNKNKSLIEGNIIIKLLGFLIFILTILTVNSSKLTSFWNGIIGFGNNFYNEWVVSISINIIIFIYLYMSPNIPQITKKVGVNIESTKYSFGKFEGILITIILTNILLNLIFKEYLPNISLTEHTENFTLIIISLIITIIYITSISR